jgi:hypothetical protein
MAKIQDGETIYLLVSADVAGDVDPWEYVMLFGKDTKAEAMDQALDIANSHPDNPGGVQALEVQVVRSWTFEPETRGGVDGQG